MPAPAARRPLSGLQKEVLRLYKRSLGLVRSKPPSTQADFRLLIRYGFRHPTLAARDVSAVEHALRTGTRRIELLESRGVTRVAVSGAMRDWWEGQTWRPTTTTTTTGEERSSSTTTTTKVGDEPRAPRRSGSTTTTQDL